MQLKSTVKWIAQPISDFINRESFGGIILFLSALAALVIANSPWSEAYYHLWENKLSFSIAGYEVSKDLHHWINEGLMAMFFFVIGLELKREIIAGELSSPKDAILPIAAGIGGMLMPAVIYLLLTPAGPEAAGWGIPMATDIAFALGILYLLGDRIPLSLKVFLTALAIVDDLGAVLVIALFYTSDISVISLLTGLGFMVLLIGANVAGVRNPVFYGILGIGGLWLAFLMSGIHATIAAVLAAFTIPARAKITDINFLKEIKEEVDHFKNAEPNDVRLVTKKQLHILSHIRTLSKKADTPLQRLEHVMHPLVIYVVMPVFAFANAGVTISEDFFSQITSPVALGVIFGLLAGKLIGVSGITTLLIKSRLAKLPDDMKPIHLLGVGLLASVGFTMSLFIADLAFKDAAHILQAKIGILMASLLGGLAGYFLLKKTS